MKLKTLLKKVLLVLSTILFFFIIGFCYQGIKVEREVDSSRALGDPACYKHLEELELYKNVTPKWKYVLNVEYTKRDSGKTIKLNVKESGIMILRISKEMKQSDFPVIYKSNKEKLISLAKEEDNEYWILITQQPETYYLHLGINNSVILYARLYENNKKKIELGGRNVTVQESDGDTNYKEFYIDKKTTLYTYVNCMNKDKMEMEFILQKKNGRKEIVNKTLKDIHNEEKIVLNKGHYVIKTKTTSGTIYTIRLSPGTEDIKEFTLDSFYFPH